MVIRSSTVIACFAVSRFRVSATSSLPIGSWMPAMSPRAIAMPTSAEMMLFDALLRLAGVVARTPW